MAPTETEHRGLLYWLTDLWRDQRGVIRTSLTPEQCRGRLQPRLAALWTLVRPVPAIGGAGRNGGWMYRPRWFSNSFCTVLRYRVLAEPSGSRIETRAGAFILIRIMMGGFALLWIANALAMVRGMGMAQAILLTLAPLGLLVVMAAFGRWAARGDAAHLTAFLAEAVEGAVVDGRPRS